MTPLPVGLSKSADLRQMLGRASSRRRRSRPRADARSPARGSPPAAAAPPRSKPSRRPIAVTDGLPSVSVPVLSTTSVSTFSMRSSASAFLISTPAPAPRPTPTMIDIGVASPRAQGQAMISTVTAATSPKASRGSGPQIDQRESEDGDEDDQRHEPAGDRSASRWIGARLRWASATIWTMRASSVSRPIFSASHDERAGLVDGAADDAVADRLRRPASTRPSPSTRRPTTGLRRPTPSTGTFSPGRTRRRSPTPIGRAVTSSSEPSGLIRRAVFGARSRSARIAPEVCSRARSSSTWPSRTSTVMTAAASK